MEEIIFVSVEELEKPEYESFAGLLKYDREHPLHRLHDYIMQFYGGLRKDVLEFLCDKENVRNLAFVIDSSQDVGLKNEWYRRLTRLLQCHAEPGWYRLCCVNLDKPQGYIQYFLNQLPGYAEQGIPVKRAENLLKECSAAYLLEYKIRTMGRVEAERCQEDNELLIEKSEEPENRKEVVQNTPEELKKVLLPLMESQNQIQSMLQDLLKKGIDDVPEKRMEAINDIEEGMPDECIEEIRQSGNEEIQEEKGEILHEENKEEKLNEEAKRSQEAYKENAFQFAKLFQQIRIKRKSVRMRKMDHTQQLQELISKMNKEGFSTEDMKVVRNLIDKEVSLEFLYSIIAEEQEAIKKLRQMYEFINYQQETTAEA